MHWGSSGALLASAQRPDESAARVWREDICSRGFYGRGGASQQPHWSRSRASWVTVRRPMENSSSQGFRIQASNAVSCSGHTTRSAQKLSSRDTWHTSSSEVRRTRAVPKQGGSGVGLRSTHCPSQFKASPGLFLSRKDPDSASKTERNRL